MFKSTTNTIALSVIIITGVIMAYAVMFGAKEVAPEIMSLWSAIIGWVVGAKSSKSKYDNANKDYGQFNDPTEQE